MNTSPLSNPDSRNASATCASFLYTCAESTCLRSKEVINDHERTTSEREHSPVARSERFDHGGFGVLVLIDTEPEKGHLVPRGEGDSGIDCEFVIRRRHCCQCFAGM